MDGLFMLSFYSPRAQTWSMGGTPPILPYPPRSLSFEHIPCSPVSWTTTTAIYWHYIQESRSEFTRRPRSGEGCGHLSEASLRTPEITGRSLIGREDEQGYCHAMGPMSHQIGSFKAFRSLSGSMGCWSLGKYLFCSEGLTVTYKWNLKPS